MALAPISSTPPTHDPFYNVSTDQWFPRTVAAMTHGVEAWMIAGQLYVDAENRPWMMADTRLWPSANVVANATVYKFYDLYWVGLPRDVLLLRENPPADIEVLYPSRVYPEGVEKLLRAGVGRAASMPKSALPPAPQGRGWDPPVPRAMDEFTTSSITTHEEEPERTVKQYHYKLVEGRDPADLVKRLNREGSEGYRLMHVKEYIHGEKPFVGFLMRELEDGRKGGDED